MDLSKIFKDVFAKWRPQAAKKYGLSEKEVQRLYDEIVVINEPSTLPQHDNTYYTQIISEYDNRKFNHPETYDRLFNKIVDKSIDKNLVESEVAIFYTKNYIVAIAEALRHTSYQSTAKYFEQLKLNVKEFAIFKTYHHIKALIEAFDKLESSTPKKMKYAISSIHYDFMKGEKDGVCGYISRSIRVSLNYQQAIKDKDLLPNLKLDAFYCECEGHKKLDGKVEPVQSDFWKTYLPPFSVDCTCSIEQTDEPVKLKKYLPTSNNPYCLHWTGILLSESMSYYNVPHDIYQILKNRTQELDLY